MIANQMTNQHVASSYYDQKTESILRKYGPGPRVHFHLGLDTDIAVPRAPRVGTTVGTIVGTTARTEDYRRALVTAQERLVGHAARIWEAPRHLSGEVLDVGCGLGGGSLFWAQEIGARVTGLTIAPAHLPYIARFAAAVGVSDRVTAVLSDAAAYSRSEPFDAAVALESSCYLPREAWFANLGRLIRPGGYVFIEDTFLGHPAAAAPFDEYWKTRVGPVAEYVAAARKAGFSLESQVDFTAASTSFWSTSIDWSRAALEERNVDPAEETRLRRSIEWQARFKEMWEERAIVCQMLAFRRG